MTGDEYRLRGGRQPDVAALTHLLAEQGELSEPLVFLASGGIGAGYELLDFTPDGSKPLLLGFRCRWREPRRWLKSTTDRMGLRLRQHLTGSGRAAAKRLTTALDAGPVLLLADRQRLGYWHLPASAEGRSEHFVVAYAKSDDVIYVDDRNLAPLTVPAPTLAEARARCGVDRNLSCLVDGATPDRARLASAVLAGLTDCVRRAPPALVAWTTWARLLTDGKPVKGWPTVFADRRGLVSALLATWSAIDPAGPAGGHCRDLFADGLAEAAPLLDRPALAEQAQRWREIGTGWQELADTALNPDVPEFGWMRGLVGRIRDGVTEGDEGRAAAAEAGAELDRLRAHYDDASPFTAEQARALYIELAHRLRTLHAKESAALNALATELKGEMP